jgi:hypothetical protein
MDPEEAIGQIVEVIDGIKSGEANSSALKKLLVKYDAKFEDPSDLYCDSFEIFSEAINDDEFRADGVGDNPVTDPEVLRLVYEYCCPGDENIEVILATSPYCPEDLLDKLAESDYSWEEDGTTQALARNQSESNLMNKLSKSQDPATRYFVAINPATELDILFNLANEPLSENNGWCDSYLYTGMFQDEIEKNTIKYAVLNNPNASKELLSAMLKEIEESIVLLETENDFLKSVYAKLKLYLEEKLKTFGEEIENR